MVDPVEKWMVLEMRPEALVLLLMDKIRLTTKDDDYPIIYRVLTSPGGCLGFCPSTVLFHQYCLRRMRFFFQSL